MKKFIFLLFTTHLSFALFAKNAGPAHLENVPVSNETNLAPDQIWVEDFRVSGDTDADVWQKAIAAMQSKRKPLFAGNRIYYFNRTITVAGDYFNLIGTPADHTSGTRIATAIGDYLKISKATAPDLSIPTATNPGPMRGAAFYFTSMIYYSNIENIAFMDFRFALAFLQPHNSPILKSLFFFYCNVGVICYQGSQNYQYVNTRSSGTGVVHVSSATCFPASTAYAGQDNYYTDGLSIKNEAGYGSFGFSDINPSFDSWFVASILRPTVKSVSANGSILYADNQGRVYENNSFYAAPTGRVVYIPMRNGRSSFGVQLSNLDVRGGVPRGFLLINNSVAKMTIAGPVQFEGMFSQSNSSTALFTVGSIIDINVVSPQYNHSGFNDPNPLFGVSGRGSSPGFAEGLGRVNQLSNKIENSIDEPYGGNYMFFTGNADRYMTWTQTGNLNLNAYTSGNVLGRKVFLTVVASATGTVTFSSLFTVIQGKIQNSKTNLLEMQWMGKYATVKIYPVP